MSHEYNYIVKVTDSPVFGTRTVQAKSLESAKMIANTAIRSEIIKIDRT